MICSKASAGLRCLSIKPPTPDRASQLLVNRSIARRRGRRPFHISSRLLVVKPFLLADIGEGIRECEVIQWFVEPEARVEQFDKLCEVQSDKASVEITSRFDGVIKRLHYTAGDMAIVGKPLVDIDIQSDITAADEAITTPPAEQAGTPSSAQQPQKAVEQKTPLSSSKSVQSDIASSGSSAQSTQTSVSHSTLATPAVRHLTKSLNVSLSDIRGTGRDGRVLKDDVQRFVSERDESTSPSATTSSTSQTETAIPLTPIQSHMFKTMTRSLSIPHFLYSDEIDFTAVDQLRGRINAQFTSSSSSSLTTSPQQTAISAPHSPAPPPIKLTSLPFILKAVSLSLSQYPLLNSRLEVPAPTDPSVSSSQQVKPTLIQRPHHNLSIAISTPQGLIVPNVKDVASKSILTLAHEINELQRLALASKLTAEHLTGGTFTVSNIGSIGGTVLSPVIVSGEVAIVGVGRGRDVPVFKNKSSSSSSSSSSSGAGNGGGNREARDQDPDLELTRRTMTSFSYAADHRVVDGATVARMSECVRGFLEDPGSMMVFLR
ncbi:MAG: hypothetical protein M1837_002978 [Sclerophora amabilis]|nr:MAG: hypothetical protein M1837_002978 [Sclerophora amabilis]